MTDQEPSLFQKLNAPPGRLEFYLIVEPPPLPETYRFYLLAFIWAQ